MPRDNHMHTCTQCGTTFDGRKRKYCTRQCASKANRNSPTKECTAPGCPKHVRARGLCSTHYNQASPSRHRKHTVPCAWCGTPVVKDHSTTRQPVCSDQCRSNIQHPPKCDLPEDHWARWINKTSTWPRNPIRPCAHCGTRFAPSSATHTHCSHACTSRAADIRRLHKAGGLTREEWSALSRECAHCGTNYTSSNSGDIYCSSRCRRAAMRRRGRRGEGGNWITKTRRQRLYERDDYICHLCHEPTNPDAHPLSDWFPSLDHLIPVSKYGTDDDGNLATAHRWCNSIRQDEELTGMVGQNILTSM